MNPPGLSPCPFSPSQGEKVAEGRMRGSAGSRTLRNLRRRGPLTLALSPQSRLRKPGTLTYEPDRKQLRGRGDRAIKRPSTNHSKTLPETKLISYGHVPDWKASLELRRRPAANRTQLRGIRRAAHDAAENITVSLYAVNSSIERSRLIEFLHAATFLSD